MGLTSPLVLLAVGVWTILLATNRRFFPYLLVAVAGLEYFSPGNPNSALTIPKAGLAALVISQFLTGRFRPVIRRGGVILALAAFSAYMGMTVMWSDNPQRSLVRATSLVLLLAMCAVVQSSIRSSDDVRRYWRAFVIYAVGNALAIGYQLLTGMGVVAEEVGARAGGLARNPTEGAFYICIAFVVLLVYHLSADRRWAVVKSGGARVAILGALAIGLLMTGSRGGILALLVSLALSSSVIGLRKQLSFRSLVGYGALALIILAFTWTVPQVRDMLWYRTTTSSADNMGNRAVIWRNMWILVKERPVTGHGIQATDITADELGRFTTTSSHNSPYGVLLDGGIIGLALFGFVALRLRRVARQARVATDPRIRLDGQVLTVLTLMAGVFMLSHDMLFNKFLWVLFAMIEAVSILSLRRVAAAGAVASPGTATTFIRPLGALPRSP